MGAPIQNTAPLTGQRVTTVNATPVAVSIFIPKPSMAYKVKVDVAAFYADGSAAGFYERVAGFRTSAANVITQVGATATPVTIEDTAAMDCELLTTTATVVENGVSVTETGIVCRVTGVAATNINWRTQMTVEPVSAPVGQLA